MECYLGDGHSLPQSVDVFGDALGSLAGNGDGERRSGNVLVGKLQVDDIQPRLNEIIEAG